MTKKALTTSNNVCYFRLFNKVLEYTYDKKIWYRWRTNNWEDATPEQLRAIADIIEQ